MGRYSSSRLHKRSSHRRHLSLEDVHLCKDPPALLRLFSKLGYQVEDEAVPLPKTEIGFSPADARAIHSLYLLADQAGQLQVVLFELEEVALARLRSLAGNFLNRGGNYLLVATTDYRRLTVVNPRREGGRVKIRKLVVDTHHPTRHDLDVLEALAADGRDPEALYRAQCEAFDVDRVTNRFYQEYAGLFRRVEQTIRQNARGIQEFNEPAYLHAFTQRLLGRIMFLYFIQKKGWLAGDPRFLTNQYRATLHDDGNYYARVLEPLFFDTLNRRRPHDESRWGSIPYLNGGLFERGYDFLLRLPNELFDSGSDNGILGFFNNYNFTVAEDTPAEQEVAVDPEMLGKVFENMMGERERGKTGTFYTPRSIVHYMCREALLGYLQEQTGLERDLLLAQFDEDVGATRESPLLTVRQANAVERALDQVRALDPAVGTGAFLVGVLHELVTLKRACYRARGVHVPRSSSLVAGWKRQFIAEALHGVDIKSEAIEIARLRLWLSLVVDLDRDQVEPLPNLDYKLMVGDSLLETLDSEPILVDVQPGVEGMPAPGTQLGLGLTRTEQAQADLATLKEACFVAETKEERDALRTEIEAQERALVLAALEEKLGDVDTRVKQLVGQGSKVNWQGMAREKRELKRLAGRKAQLSDLAQRVRAGEPLPFFLYRLHFFEVFRDKGGFDIVIANPPYVRQELIKEHKAAFKAAYPEVYHGVADLYVYFYARGLELLRPGGMLAYISSNKFMRAGYGANLRRLLSEETTLERIIDFGDLPVFEATAYPSIVITRKGDPPADHKPQVLTVNDMETLARLEEEVPRQAWPLPQVALGRDGWTLERPEVLRLVEKLRAAGRPLGEYIQGRFFNGVKTGLNKAFVIDEATEERLIADDPRSTELIKPWIQGRDIDRWTVHWQHQYILYVTWDCPIEHYPAVQAHLSQFREALERRDGVRNSGPCPWYALSRPRPKTKWAFEGHKIMYPHFNTVANFAFDEKGRFSNDKTYIIPTDELSLLGVLNSKPVEFLMRHLSPAVQRGYMEFRTIYVGQVPVPDIPPSERQTIEKLVRRLLDLRGEGPAVEALEQELNERVYRLFGLTAEEVRLIEERSG